LSNITITVPNAHFQVKYWIYFHNSVTLEFSTDFRKVFIHIYFIQKISSFCSTEYSCGQKDRQTHLTKLTVDFRRHSNYWCILSARCNTHTTHRMFCPQYPSAVSSAHCYKSYEPTSWRNSAW